MGAPAYLKVLEDLRAQILGGEAAALRITPGASVIVVHRDHHAGGKPVETSEIVVPAERFGLRYRLGAGGSEDP